MSRTGRAFAPGHLTAFFSVHYDDDPRRAGSRGAGVTIADGVTVTVNEGDGRTLNGVSTEIEAVDRVVAALDVPAGVTIETDLPLGMGFGVSGAAALATALAADHHFNLDRPEDALVELAHIADVEAGTGLGDVIAQAHGGVPVRVEPGVPPYGCIEPVPGSGRVEYLPLGTLSTPAILSGNTNALTEIGDTCVSALRADPTLPHLAELGRRFADEAGFLDAELRELLEAVVAVGGDACMGMLGRTVFAFGDGLSRAGFEPTVTQVSETGAHVIDSE